MYTHNTVLLAAVVFFNYFVITNNSLYPHSLHWDVAILICPDAPLWPHKALLLWTCQLPLAMLLSGVGKAICAHRLMEVSLYAASSPNGWFCERCSSEWRSKLHAVLHQYSRCSGGAAASHRHVVGLHQKLQLIWSPESIGMVKPVCWPREKLRKCWRPQHTAVQLLCGMTPLCHPV